MTTGWIHQQRGNPSHHRTKLAKRLHVGCNQGRRKNRYKLIMPNVSAGESLRMSIVACAGIGHEKVGLHWLRRACDIP